MAVVSGKVALRGAMHGTLLATFAALLAVTALSAGVAAHLGAESAGPPLGAASLAASLEFEGCEDCPEPPPHSHAPLGDVAVCPATSTVGSWQDICRRLDGQLEQNGLVLAPPHSAGGYESVRYREEQSDTKHASGSSVCVGPTDPHRVVLVYAHPKGTPDRSAAKTQEIRNAFERSNDAIYTEGMREGVPLNMRVECENGQPKVHSVALSQLPEDVTFDQIVTDTRAAWNNQDRRIQLWVVADLHGYGQDNQGLVRTQFHYTITNADGEMELRCCRDLEPPIMDDCDCAGTSTVPSAAELQLLNGNQPCVQCNPPVSVTYDGDGYRGSKQTVAGSVQWLYREDNWRWTTMLHEGMHGFGAMQPNAPGNNGKGHCNDGPDYMCYDETSALYPELGDQAPNKYTTQACTDRIHLDCGRDTYFDPIPETGSFLDTAWNTGGPENKVLERGTQSPVSLTARDDYYLVRSDKLIANGMALAMPVTSNDDTSSTTPLTVQLKDAPTKGTVTLQGTTFHYTPQLPEIGSDTFTYTVSDGIDSKTATVWIDLDHKSEPIDLKVEILEDSLPLTYDLSVHCGDDAHHTDMDQNWDVFAINGYDYGTSQRPSPIYRGGFDEARRTACTQAPDRPNNGYYTTPRIEHYEHRTNRDYFGDVTLSIQYYDYHFRKNSVAAGDVDAGCCKYDSIRPDVEVKVLPVNDPPIAPSPTYAAQEDALLKFTLRATDVDGEPQANVHPKSSPPVDYPGGDYSSGKQAFGELIFTVPATSVEGGKLSRIGTASQNGALQFTVPATATGPYGTEGLADLNYAPAADFCGTDTVGYSVSDGEFQAQGVITFNVACINDPPNFTAPAKVTSLEDAGPTTNDTFLKDIVPGPENENTQSVTISIVQKSSNNANLFAAAPTLVAAGQTAKLQFESAANQCGTATFEIIATDDGAPPESKRAPLSLEVTCVNDVPIPVDDIATLQEGNVMALDVLANDAGGDEDDGVNGVVHDPEQLRLLAPTTPWTSANGVALKLVTGLVELDVDDGWCNAESAQDPADSFTYTVQDDGLAGAVGALSAEGTASFRVMCINDPPSFSLTSNQIAAPEDNGTSAFNAIVTKVSPGPANEAGQAVELQLSLISTTHVSLFASNPELVPASKPGEFDLRFTPAADACGTAIYELTATDNGSPPATSEGKLLEIRVTCVNDAPEAMQDFVQVYEDQSALFDVLANDLGGDTTSDDGNVANGVGHAPEQLRLTSVEGASIGIEGVSDAGHTVTIVNNQIVWTPRENACNDALDDRIAYTVADDGLGGETENKSATGTVAIRVLCVNDAPSFDPGPDIAIVAPEPPVKVSLTDWATNLSVGPAEEPQTQNPKFVVTPSDAAHFLEVPQVSQLGRLHFTPAAGWFGETTFEVCMFDDGGTAHGGIDAGGCHTVNLRVDSVNDPPIFQPGDHIEVAEDSGRYDAPWATDISPGPADEAWQTVRFSVETLDPSLFADLPAIDANGSLTFRPASNAFGSTVIRVQAIDDGGTAHGGRDRTYLLERTIIIVPVNDPPQAQPDQYIVKEEHTLMATATDGVLINDLDVDGDKLHPVVIGAPRHGALDFRSDGTFTYKPEDDYFGTDHFVYKVVDAAGAESEALVTITVLNVNDPPIGLTDYMVVRPDGPAVFTADAGVLANDIDADRDELRAELLKAPVHGDLQLDQDGAFTYTPGDGFQGTDAFTYRALDNNGGSSLASVVHLRIEGNTPPNAAFNHEVPILAGRPTLFTDASVDPDGDGHSAKDANVQPHLGLRAWYWEFGDGKSSTEASPRHTYASPGEYTVRLTVTDLEGQQDALEKTIRVHSASGEPPVVAVPAMRDVMEGQPLPLEASFESSVDAISWRQLHGPHVPILHASDPMPVATAPYLDDGQPVTLAFGVTASALGIASPEVTQTIRVVPNPAYGAVTLGNDRTVAEGESVNMQANATGFSGPVTFTWQQLDGPVLGIGNPASPVIEFVVPMDRIGQTVLLEVTATAGARIARDTVELRIAPVAKQSDLHVRALPDGAYHFLAPAGVARTWDFGDGTTSNATNPVHTFPEAGSYRVLYEGLDVQGRPLERFIDVDVPARPEPQSAPASERSLPTPWLVGGALAVTAGAAAIILLRRR